MVGNQMRAQQLYQQCQEAYDEFLTMPHTKSILSIGGKDIDIPSNFYDAYNVPAELLHQELRGGASSEVDRMDFDHKLLQMMYGKRSFDPNILKRIAKPKDKQLQKQYTVYFETYYHQSSSSRPLFKNQLRIDGITYKWCSKQTFRRYVQVMESHEGAYRGLYKQRCNERFSLRRDEPINNFNLRPIQATVKAFSDTEAVNIVAEKFNGFVSCVNVMQAFGSLSFTAFSDKPKTKHKTAIVSVDVLLVKSPDKSVDILWDTSKQILPKQSLTMTDNPMKMKRLMLLMKAFCDSSPAARRLKIVTQELSQAVSTDNPNLRQLSYWRCLEIATAKSNYESRKESDIVKIFQNYHAKLKHWHQMGAIVKKMRNTYVHEGVGSGKHNLNEYHLNWSQQYAEAAFGVVLYLYEHRATWKTDSDIDTFFDYYTKSDGELSLANKFLTARRVTRQKGY